MISSCHFDLLSYYWYAHLLPYYGQINTSLSGGFVCYRPIFYLLGSWLFIIKGFMNGGLSPWPQEWFLNNQFHLVNFDSWVRFVSNPQIQWILFLLKFPYFLAEIAMILLVLKMIHGKEDKNFVLKFLLFNPVSLFSVYIFGSDDVFIVSLIVLSIFLIKRKKWYLGMFTLACSVSFKLYPIIFFPFYIALFSNNWLKRLKLLCVALLPALFIGLILFFTGKLPFASYYMSRIPHVDYVFSMSLPFAHMGNAIYIFVAAYVWFMLYIIYERREIDFSVDPDKIFLVLALLFYSLCFFHPQYFLLIVPLMALQIPKDRKLVPLFSILVFCFMVYTWQWGKDMAGNLFLPLNPVLFSGLKPPMELIDSYFPVAKFFNIFRTIFISVSFWIIYQIMKRPKIKS